jgi:hypothetical protein
MSDRPATECEVEETGNEVTPEMIEAGVDTLMAYDVIEGFNREEWGRAVAAVFCAMR